MSWVSLSGLAPGLVFVLVLVLGLVFVLVFVLGLGLVLVLTRCSRGF